MFGDKLVEITKKLETYIEKAQDMIEELEEFRDIEAGTETEIECVRRIEEIIFDIEDIKVKVNDNESKVKNKIEEVVKEFQENRKSSRMVWMRLPGTPRS